MVHDRPNNLVVLKAVLDSPEYNVVFANSGKEALAAFTAQDFALVLLDIQMPDMDGYETARRIKETDKGKDGPIIFITAIYREEPHVKMGYDAGAIDYF